MSVVPSQSLSMPSPQTSTPGVPGVASHAVLPIASHARTPVAMQAPTPTEQAVPTLKPSSVSPSQSSSALLQVSVPGSPGNASQADVLPSMQTNVRKLPM